MDPKRFQIERNGKFITIRSCNDALGVARGAFPEIRKQKLSYNKRGKETQIGKDIFVTELDS